jgi:hypothetical protein
MTLPNVDMNLLDQPTLEKVQAKELGSSTTYFAAVWL